MCADLADSICRKLISQGSSGDSDIMATLETWVSPNLFSNREPQPPEHSARIDGILFDLTDEEMAYLRDLLDG